MYVRYVREVHCPILMMVLSEAPLNFIAMAPLARRLWDDTWSRVYPRARRQSAVAPHRTAIVMSLSNMVELVLGLMITVLRGVANSWPRRLSIRQANAATGQIVPPTAK
jgi:hypothetical protein